MSNTYTKGYADGNALTEPMLDNAYQTLQLDIANTALTTTGSSSKQVLTSNGSGIAASFQTIPDPQGPFSLRNYGLKATVAAGVMTISLKTKALATPSGTDIVDFNYSTNGTTSASYTSVQVTAATTFSISASATLGAASTSTTHIFVYGYYNTVTTSVKLAVSSYDAFDFGEAISTTAMSASADSPAVLYATAALTVMPRYLGHVVAAHTSAGNWQTPSKVNVTNTPLTSPLEWNRARSPSSTARLGQVAISSSSGNYNTTGTLAVQPTNLSVSLTTAGRPVIIKCVSASTATATGGVFQISGLAGSTNASIVGNILIYRDSTLVNNIAIKKDRWTTAKFDSLNIPCSAAESFDSPVAGTYTYTVKIQLLGVSGVTSYNFQAFNIKLVAYEI